MARPTLSGLLPILQPAGARFGVAESPRGRTLMGDTAVPRNREHADASSPGGGRDPVVVELQEVVVAALSLHSERAAARPLRRNRVIPLFCLICPKTGSMLDRRFS